MKRRIILVLLIVVVLGLIVGGFWYIAHRNQGPKILARAQINLRNGQFDRALELAGQYIAKYPGDWRGYFMQGQAQIGRAAYDEARVALEKAQNLNPADAGVAIALSRTYSLPKDRDLSSDKIAALEAAVAALVKADELLDAWSARAAQGPAPRKEDQLDVTQEKARNLMRKANAQRAEAVVREKEAEVQRTVGNSARAAEKDKEALAARALGKQSEKEALELLKAVVVGDPQRDWAGRLAIQLSLTQDDPESLSQIRQAINSLSLKDRPPVCATMLAMRDLQSMKDPFSEDAAKKRKETAELLDKLLENMPEESPDRPTVVLSRAQVALTQGQAEEVLELLKPILKDNPRHGQARLTRARALILLGRVAQAEQELLTLKTDFSQWEDAQFAYAHAAMMAGKPETAREALRKIVKDLNPRNREALRSLTAYMISQGSYGQAFLDAREYYNAYPDDPESVRLLVRVCHYINQPLLARETLEKATADYPKSPAMLLAVADGWELLGDAAKASDAIRRAAAVKPEAINDLQAVVLALIRDGRMPEAEKVMYDAMTGNPNHPVIRFLLGKLFSATQRYLQAIEEYRKAIAMDPDNDVYKLELAAACFSVGDLNGAEELLQQIHKPDEAVEKLAQRIRLVKGGDAEVARKEAGLDGARYYLSVGQPGKCIEICQAELDKGAGQTEVDVRRLLGRAYLAQGRPDLCLKEWMQVLDARPADPFIYQAIAGVMSQTQTPSQVEAAFTSAPKARRDMIDLTLGWLADRRGDYGVAAECYGKAADQKDSTEDRRNSARMLRAQALANAGKLDDAVLEAEKISGPGPWQRQSLWVQARLLLAANKTRQAESILMELHGMALKAQDQAILRDLARLYGSMNQTDKAAGICDELLRQFPNDARTYTLKASILTNAGKLDEAVEWYRKAIERQPGNLGGYINLAGLMDLRQEPEQALEVLKQLESTGDAGQAAALSQRGEMFTRWGLPTQAVTEYEQLSKLGYGSLPRVRLALGRSFARLEMKDLAKQVLADIPKYSSEYVMSQQLLADLADTPDAKLEILHRLSAERPGLPSVLAQEMQILTAQKRYADAVAAYRRFGNTVSAGTLVPSDVAFLALQSMLNAGDDKSATELSLRMAGAAPRSAWRNIAIVRMMSEDPAGAAKMVPQAANADLVGALLGLACARQSGAPTKPWADRIRQIDGEMANAKLSRRIPSHYKVLVDLANGDVKEAEAELSRFYSYSIVGKNVATELVSYAKGGAEMRAELIGLIRATAALDLGLPTMARAYAFEVLNRRPECQWAAALIVQGMPDAAVRRRVLEILKPSDCIVAKVIQATQADEENAPAKAAEIYRSLADLEKENPEILVRLAVAEAAVGNVEKALALHQKSWQLTHSPIAANNIAYLTISLWPQDKARLTEARAMSDAAIKSAPDLPAFLDTQGWIAHLQGDDERALKSLRQAVKGMPESVEIHAHLGVVEAAAGNRDLASWHLAAAVKNAGRLKARGEALSPEQLDGLKLAEKTLSEWPQPEE